MNYLPLFQDEDFDNELGDGTEEEVMQVLGPRFNINGGPIPGQTVGLGGSLSTVVLYLLSFQPSFP